MESIDLLISEEAQQDEDLKSGARPATYGAPCGPVRQSAG